MRKVAALEHKYLLRYYSAFEVEPSLVGRDFKFAIVTELCTGVSTSDIQALMYTGGAGGTLEDKIKDVRDREPAVVLKRLKQLSEGLRYLHCEERMLHLDLKR